MFDSAFGLPLHPLLVHLPVVLLPLAAVLILGLVVRPSWRPRYGIAALGVLVLGAGGAVLAKLSGDALAARVGIPATHENWGTTLMIVSLVYLALGGGWLLWTRRAEVATGAQNLAGVVVAALSVAVVVLTVLTGHSGATAVWGGSATPTSSASSPAPTSGAGSPSASPTGSGSPSASASASASQAGYSLAQVAEHATPADCWAAIEGNVYDLTSWIDQHPGGADRIIALCGTDATTAFERQHAGQPKPSEELAKHLLGPLLG
ncbi:hypothetical protein BW730_17080 [Tessaracoccus aquimaris]|uniref:Cytochrome b5 heme-binding domain-containing protein n=1 Tax=Tessaracoccus aquimaris TaxID=1332264 RepID=A0A1Q2CS75_9ACTN|nr:cytochrome b5-like heme/steroid binding domain-containing protein [Tessaracoccus aquimaris]AQP48957.1 hypothetical protein BW730_17080 [Tessaracoccus aquimaris]